MHNKDRMYSLNSPNDALIRTILLNKQKKTIIIDQIL